MKTAQQSSEQRRSDAANAQEFHQIQQFVAECRRLWPGAMIVLRPDGAPVAGPANEHARAFAAMFARIFIGGNSKERTMENSNSNLPTQNNDVADIVLQKMVARTPLLRFRNGVFQIGQDEVLIGTEYTAYPLDGRWGWVLFEDRQLIDQRMGPISGGPIPKPDERDWQFQYQIPLETMDGELIAFVTSSQPPSMVAPGCTPVARPFATVKSLDGGEKSLPVAGCSTFLGCMTTSPFPRSSIGAPRQIGLAPNVVPGGRTTCRP
jgi:hypothetical protein